MSAEDKPRDKLYGIKKVFSPSLGLGAPSTGGSWFGFLFKLCLFLGVCVGAFQGYKVYQQKNGRGRAYGGGGAFGGGGGFADGIGKFTDRFTGNSKRF